MLLLNNETILSPFPWGGGQCEGGLQINEKKNKTKQKQNKNKNNNKKKTNKQTPQQTNNQIFEYKDRAPSLANEKKMNKYSAITRLKSTH